MSVVRARRRVAAAPEEAFALWVDARRWEIFVDGFASIESLDADWPAVGATLVWRSVPDGRGRVVERVVEYAPPARFATDVAEPALTGRQRMLLQRDLDGAAVEVSLDYSLAQGGPLRWLTDVLFIRRAETEALARTLARFAAEAEEL